MEARTSWIALGAALLVACGTAGTNAGATESTGSADRRPASVEDTDTAPAALPVTLSPATLSFVPSTTPMRGTGRVSWPAPGPEPAWIRASHLHVDAEETRIEPGHLHVSALLWAAPGLDPERCTLELLWSRTEGAQASSASSIERHDGGLAEVRWVFDVPMQTDALTVLPISAYAFCQDGVRYSALPLPVAGPRAQEALCIRPRPPTDGLNLVSLEPNVESAVLRTTCGTLLRRRGSELIDACDPQTVIGDTAGIDIGLDGIPEADAPITRHELGWLVQWSQHGRGPTCGGEIFRVSFVGPVGAGGATRLEDMARSSDAILDLWSLHGVTQPGG